MKEQLERLACTLGICAILPFTAALEAQEQPKPEANTAFVANQIIPMDGGWREAPAVAGTILSAGSLDGLQTSLEGNPYSTDRVDTEPVFGGLKTEDETDSHLAAASQEPSDPDSSPTSAIPEPPHQPVRSYAGPWDKRRNLTGNSVGVRDSLAAHGVFFSASLTQFYQGLVAGAGDDTFKYGGKAKLTTLVDAGKLGLWKGFGVIVGGEYNFGRTASYAGHTLLPTNTAMTFPSLNENGGDLMTVAVAQRLGERLAVLFGKFNAFDVYAAGNEFHGGGGLDKFQHIVFEGTPSGTVPVCLFGGIAVMKTRLAQVTLMFYDPEDQQNQTGLAHPFREGVTFYGSMLFARTFHGLSSKHTFSASTSTEKGINLADLPDISLPPGSIGDLSQKTGRWYVGYSFEQTIWRSKEDKKKAWGLFGQTSMSDGNPNPQRWLVMGGVGGTSPIRGRSWDKFGAAGFCYGLSRHLINGLAPTVIVGDECGGEVFYNFAVTPWFLVSADLQVIEPANRAYPVAVLFGLRAQIRF